MIAWIPDATPPSDGQILGRIIFNAAITAICSAICCSYGVNGRIRQTYRFIITGIPFYIFGLAIIDAYGAISLAREQAALSALGQFMQKGISDPLQHEVTDPSVYDYLRVPGTWWTVALAEKYVAIAVWYTLGIMWCHQDVLYVHVIGLCISAIQIALGFYFVRQHVQKGPARYAGWSTDA